MPPIPKTNSYAAATNIKPEIHVYKLAQQQFILAFAIVCVAGNDNIIDLIWVILLQVRYFMTFWFFIVSSDNAMLATN